MQEAGQPLLAGALLTFAGAGSGARTGTAAATTAAGVAATVAPVGTLTGAKLCAAVELNLGAAVTGALTSLGKGPR